VETKPEPKPEPEPAPPPPQPETRPKPALEKGDVAFDKPVDKPKEEVLSNPLAALAKPNPPRQHAMSMAEADQRKGGMAGQRMKQDGGVKRYRMDATLDVRATPFGSYDAAIIAAIQKHWYDLLEARPFAANYSGKVVLEFRLNSNGSVTEMKVTENTVTDILGLVCQRAVQEPAPFAKWPADLRRLVGKDYREVRFTFYYN